MRKFFRILFIVLLIIFVAVLTVPFLFKGEIMKFAKQEVNKNVKASVDWSDIRISLFRGFPDLKVTLDDVAVTGLDQFRDDTLMAFKDFSADIDLISAFSGKIKVKSIIIDKPVVRAIALKDGTVNWDITYPSADTGLVEEPEDTSGMNMVVDLKEFRINDGSIHYTDEALNMNAELEKFGLLLSGNLSEDFTDLDLNTGAERVTVNYDGINYLNNTSVSLKALIGADLENSKFTLNDNELRVNDLVLGMEGFFGMPSDTVYDMDLKYFTRKTDFKSLLSLIPVIYMQDYSGLRTSGSLMAEGTVKGVYSGNLLPDITLSLQVNDGQFSYPDLPKSASNINMDLHVFYDGVNEDNTTVDLNRFHIEVAGNPVDMNFHVITPFSDLQMNGAVNGKLDLSSVADVIPVEDMNLQGVITADIQMMGKMSDIENEHYESFMAEGSLEASGMEISGGEVPKPVKIDGARLVFSPRFINLENFDGTIGVSDFHLDGRLENFIPYFFSDEILRGQMNMNSRVLDLNELMAMPDEEEEIPESADTFALTAVEIPKNIDFTFQAALGKVNYDKLTITDLKGRIVARDGILSMNDLTMELLGGSMNINGDYDSREVVTPLIDFNMDMNRIDISSAFYSFNTVEKLAPVAEMCRGKVSTALQISARLDSTMNPVLNTLNGKGVLKTDRVEIINNKTLDKVADALKNDKFRNPVFSDVNLSFQIRDGRVYVDPFTTQLGSTAVTIGGDQGLDQTMNYLMTFTVPRDEFGNTANDVLENLAGKARSAGFDINPGEKVNIQVKITGTFTDPKISLALKENLQKAQQEIRKAVQDRVKEEVSKAKEEIKKDVSAEIDRIMQDAQEQADKLRSSAKDAGEALVGEAELRKKQLVNEAGSNPLKKLAAEKTGEQLVKKAKQQAEKLKEEADQKAEAIMEKAKEKAEELKNK